MLFFNSLTRLVILHYLHYALHINAALLARQTADVGHDEHFQFLIVIKGMWLAGEASS